jgi:hypothetical protein
MSTSGGVGGRGPQDPLLPDRFFLEVAAAKLGGLALRLTSSLIELVA